MKVTGIKIHSVKNRVNLHNKQIRSSFLPIQSSKNRAGKTTVAKNVGILNTIQSHLRRLRFQNYSVFTNFDKFVLSIMCICRKSATDIFRKHFLRKGGVVDHAPSNSKYSEVLSLSNMPLCFLWAINKAVVAL